VLLLAHIHEESDLGKAFEISLNRGMGLGRCPCDKARKLLHIYQVIGVLLPLLQKSLSEIEKKLLRYVLLVKNSLRNN
jgi:hypothetical protein